jgi:hypothetical protein
VTYPERIVCLTEETTETLYLLGEGQRVVGISGYTHAKPKGSGWSSNLHRVSIAFANQPPAFPDAGVCFSKSGTTRSSRGFNGWTS